MDWIRILENYLLYVLYYIFEQVGSNIRLDHPFDRKVEIRAKESGQLRRTVVSSKQNVFWPIPQVRVRDFGTPIAVLVKFPKYGFLRLFCTLLSGFPTISVFLTSHGRLSGPN